MKLSGVLKRARQWAKANRAVVSPGASPSLHLFELLDAVRRCGIPSITLSEALDRLRGLRRPTDPADAGAAAEAADADRGAVLLHPSLRGGGSGSVGEMASLASLSAARRPRSILEFGTNDGASTWHLLANAHPSCTLTTLDLPANVTVEGSSDLSLQGVTSRPFLPADPRVSLVEIDSRAWVPDVSAVELCFIDAGHTYECVRNDTEKARRTLAPDGVIVWHDAAWRHDGYGVNAYLKELRADGMDVRLLHIGNFDYCGIAIYIP